jgi:CRISPR-associated endonuclease/helicase Cas3
MGGKSTDEYFVNDDIRAAREFLEAAVQLFLTATPRTGLNAKELFKGIKRCSWLLAGISVLCDWIGSNEKYFPYESQERNLRGYLSDSREKALRGLKESGVLPVSVAQYSGVRNLFKNILRPSPLQAHVDASDVPNVSQLWILEDLTGSGKTEAAVILAHRIMSLGLADGLFFALPTMATANAMYDRIANAYRRLFDPSSKPDLILTHSARNLSDRFQKSVLSKSSRTSDQYRDGEETAEAICAAWLADSGKKAFLADVGVGTIDQALVSILPVKHQSLRLLGLARKVLIVDEVHAYDPYMHSLLRKLLHFHAALGGAAILLSATLPRRTRNELLTSFSEGWGEETEVTVEKKCYPLVTRFAGASVLEASVSERTDQRRNIRVELLSDESAVKRLALGKAENGSCVCWIRNTVTDALEAYNCLLRSGFPKEKLLLFHARFAMGDRIMREEEVLEAFGPKSGHKQRTGKILIATQVVEQSLDLDFDVMITDLAPIDLIIQRAGRLRRHLRDHKGNVLPWGASLDGRGEPTLHVYSPDPVDQPKRNWYSKTFEKAAYVYPDHGRLWLSARLLKSEKYLRLPHNARRLIEGVYGNETEEIPPGLEKSSNNAEGEGNAGKSLANLNALNLEEGYVDTLGQWVEDTETPTRLGEASVQVRLARWDGRELRPWFEHSGHPWEMSQVSVRESLMKEEKKTLDKVLNESVISTKESMPDKGRWSVLLPLTPLDDNVWTGSALNNSGEEVTLVYSERLGLSKAE